MPSACEELNAQYLLQGYVELQSYGLAHLKSSALTCATGLGIPGAIARHRGGATISEIMVETGLHQSKLPYLRRLLHVLTVTGVFASSSSPVDDSKTIYKLTPMSSLLVPDTDSTTCDMSALLHILTRPTTTVSTFFNLEAWFREDGAMTPFEVAHGMSPWSLTKNDASYNDVMNHASVADTNFIMSIVLKEAAGRDIFHGLSSIIDVAGGHGAAAVAIARAFPHMKCSVLDLEQVINKAPTNATVQYIVGDMFKYIPRADAVLLKTVLNSWDDDSCVKILQQCKRAILGREAGGKVIVINAVVGYGTPDIAIKEAQVLLDLYMMRGCGREREEGEWAKVFSEAGFSSYKFTTILGPVSIIEVFP